MHSRLVLAIVIFLAPAIGKAASALTWTCTKETGMNLLKCEESGREAFGKCQMAKIVCKSTKKAITCKAESKNCPPSSRVIPPTQPPEPAETSPPGDTPVETEDLSDL